MKTLSILLLHAFILLNISSCNGQNKSLNPLIKNDPVVSMDTSNKPKINVKVNKEFDSKGNLTRYDSTYSYVYKGGNIDINDSLFPFRSLLREPPTDLFKNPGETFFSDSLFKKHFFDDGFFEKYSELNKMLFDGSYPQVDSLGNRVRNGTSPKSVNKSI